MTLRFFLLLNTLRLVCNVSDEITLHLAVVLLIKNIFVLCVSVDPRSPSSQKEETQS